MARNSGIIKLFFFIIQLFKFNSAKFRRNIRIPKIYTDKMKKRLRTSVQRRSVGKNLFDFAAKPNKFPQSLLKIRIESLPVSDGRNNAKADDFITHLAEMCI